MLSLLPQLYLESNGRKHGPICGVSSVFLLFLDRVKIWGGWGWVGRGVGGGYILLTHYVSYSYHVGSPWIGSSVLSVASLLRDRLMFR